MTTVSIRRNFAVSSVPVIRNMFDGPTKGYIHTVSFQGQIIGKWEVVTDYEKRRFDEDMKVLAAMRWGDSAWLDASHYHTYPNGESHDIHYGCELSIQKGVSARRESSVAYRKHCRAKTLLRPTVPVWPV